MRFIKANAQLRLRLEDSPEVYQVIYDQCGGFVECDANAQVIWEACRDAILNGDKG